MNDIRTTQANPGPNLINFGIGQPALDLLPLDMMRQAAEIRLSTGDATLLNYGYELGDGYFLLALARFLQPHYGFPVSADSLMTTSGASQALDLICTRFTNPGDTVFVAEPTYFLALRIFADHHLRVISIPTDDDGLIMEALTSALADHRPVLLYTVPTFQNPTGATLPNKRRRQLAALSEEYDFLIAADEVYHLLDYNQTPPPPLAAFIENGRIFSIGSFSKILGPGLRLGWVQAAPALLQNLADSGLVDSGGGLNPFTSNLVRIVLERGWQDAYLTKLKAIYKWRVAVMAAALTDHMSAYGRFVTPHGGFFFWLALHEDIDTSALLEPALKQNVGFQPGSKFSSTQGLRNCMRLSFAYYNDDEIRLGIERLGKLIENI